MPKRYTWDCPLDTSGRVAQVSSKLDKEDVAKIEKEVNDCISWLDANQLVRSPLSNCLCS